MNGVPVGDATRLTRATIAAAFGLIGTLACAHSAAPASPPAGSDTVEQKQLEQTALQRQVEAGLAALRPCYARERARDPEIERRIAFVLYVMPSGNIEDVTLIDAVRPGDPPHPSQLTQAIAECAGREILRWRLAPSGWHGDVSVDRPPIFMAHFAPKPAANAGDDARATAEKRIIGATLAGRRADAASCYDDYVVRTSAAGDVKVVVQFIILANGTVSDASIVAPPPVDERFGACLLEVVRSTRFAVAPERPPNLVTYPFRFTPGP